jgi:streptomycin 6-kinase
MVSFVDLGGEAAQINEIVWLQAMQSYFVPGAFATTIAAMYGDKGRNWLAGLPALLADCARRWDVQVGAPFASLSFNYVAAASAADGRELVLKAGVPHPELFSEMAALQHYAGRGCVRLLDHDQVHGVMLLERLKPGTMLSTLTDDATATRIAAEVMRELWRPPPENHSFPHVHDWMGGLQRLREHFGGGSGPLPEWLMAHAEARAAALLTTMAEPLLLHGDLHHYNILRAERTPWLAIDPKGVIGEAAYDTGALLRNPIPQIGVQSDLPAVMAQRVDILSRSLGLSHDRILGWGLAQAVLSAWWSIEDDSGGWEPAVACAEALAAIGG